MTMQTLTDAQFDALKRAVASSQYYAASRVCMARARKWANVQEAWEDEYETYVSLLNILNGDNVIIHSHKGIEI